MKRYILILAAALSVCGAGLCDTSGANLFNRGRKGSIGVSVAASDASQDDKATADYLCDGVDDHVQIQAAIDSLPNIQLKDAGVGGGGKVSLSQGTFNTTDSIYLKNYLYLEGTGQWSTHINYVGDDGDVSAITVRVGDGILFFVTIDGLGLWGNKDRSVLMSSGSGSGVDGAPNVDDFLSDSRVINCWAAWWPSYGFRMGTWHQQLMYSTAEYCMFYGVRGFSEVIGTHSKYNGSGFRLESGTKLIGCMSQINYNYGAFSSVGKTVIEDVLFNGDCSPVHGRFATSTETLSLRFEPIFLSKACKIASLTNSNSDVTRFNALLNILYYKIVDDTGGNWHIDFYKTTTLDVPAVYSNLVAHTASFSANGNIGITQDNSSSIAGSIDIVNFSTIVASENQFIGIPFGTDPFARAVIDSFGPDNQIINNRMSLDGLLDAGSESTALYAIRAAGDDTIITGNIIKGNTPTTRLVRLDTAASRYIVTNNNIEAPTLTTGATGLSYARTTTNDGIVRNNIIHGTAASLTTPLDFGANTDYSADNILLNP